MLASALTRPEELLEHLRTLDTNKLEVVREACLLKTMTWMTEWSSTGASRLWTINLNNKLPIDSNSRCNRRPSNRNQRLIRDKHALQHRQGPPKSNKCKSSNSSKTLAHQINTRESVISSSRKHQPYLLGQLEPAANPALLEPNNRLESHKWLILQLLSLEETSNLPHSSSKTGKIRHQWSLQLKWVLSE